MLGALFVNLYSACTKISCAPAAKCTPSPIASTEILLRNAVIPGKEIALIFDKRIQKTVMNMSLYNVEQPRRIQNTTKHLEYNLNKIE